MARFSIPNIAETVSGKHGISKTEAENFVTAVFDLINSGLYQDKIVKVKGLGTFKIIDVRDRESVNVNTGERVKIESHGKITFTPDPVMRDLVNKPFAQFETVILNDGVEIEELNNTNSSDNDEEDDTSIAEETDDSVNETGYKEETVIEDIAEEGPTKRQATDMSEETKEALPEKVVDEPSEEIILPENGFQPVEEKPEEEEPAVTVETTHEPNVSRKEEPVIMPKDTKSEDIEEQEDTNITTSDEEEKVNEEEELYEESFISRNKHVIFALITLLLSAVAFFGGYKYHEYTSEPVVKYIKVNVHKKQVVVPARPHTSTIKDTAIVKKEEITDKEKKDVTAAENKPVIKEKPVKTTDTAADNGAEMRNARAKVNTGAYRIIGTDAVITVKKGENIKRISDFYFGTGMECYVQVHNGVTEVKEGQKLRIPKLVNKKKKI